MEKYILRVRRKLECDETPNSKILKYLHQLEKLPVTFEILKGTSIGKTVNRLKKHAEIEIQEKSKELVLKWKQQVSEDTQSTTEENDLQHKTEKYHLLNKQDHKHHHRTHSKHRPEPVDSNIASKQSTVHENNLHVKSRNVSSSREFVEDSSHYAPKVKKQKFASFDFLSTPQKGIEDNEDELDDTENCDEKVQEQPPSWTKRSKSAMPSLPDIELPDVVPVYRPMFRQSDLDTDNDSPKKKMKAVVNDSDSMVNNFMSRKSRTAVFSGRKYSQFSGVPSLYQQCMRVLIENVDALHDTGGVPYDILEPLLAKCSPTQLAYLEECNPYFTEDTDVLWKAHCQREFKGSQPDEDETWREFYQIKFAQREEKLRKINERITASQATKEPVRQAKLAYVATPPKPPSHIRRQKSRYSTGEEITQKGEKKSRNPETHDRKRQLLSSLEAQCGVPCPMPRRDASSTKKPAPPTKKPASKPMMQAALKMMKKQRSRIAANVIRR